MEHHLYVPHMIFMQRVAIYFLHIVLNLPFNNVILVVDNVLLPKL